MSLYTSAAVKTMSSAPPAGLLQGMLDASLALSSSRADIFRFQLGEVLLKLSETADQPAVEQASFHAYNHLRRDGQTFSEAFDGAFAKLCGAAVRALEKGSSAALPALPAGDFDAIQDSVLLDELAQRIERRVAEPLASLSAVLASLTGSDVQAAANPWRPQHYVLAFYQAWCAIDSQSHSRRLVLGMLGPELFLPLETIYAALNAQCAEHGIAAHPAVLARERRGLSSARGEAEPAAPALELQAFATTLSPVVRPRGQRYCQVRDWLLGPQPQQAMPAVPQPEPEHLNLPDLFAPAGDNGPLQTNTISVSAGARLYAHLTHLQKQTMDTPGNEAPAGGSLLRKLAAGLAHDMLSPLDVNTVELVARIFDIILLEQALPAAMKDQLARLQIPVLKAALLDRKFFIDSNHPAHRLLNQLVACGMGWAPDPGQQDKLLNVVSHIVSRINSEFALKVAIFSAMSAELEAFLNEEESQAEAALAGPVQLAMRSERLYKAEQAARADIVLRLESGAVPYFLEPFLQQQWQRILTLAHKLQDKKPGLVERARKAIDDLVWSLQPRPGAEERQRLLARLPGILAEVNAWLDAIKWQGPERVSFFASLAEQHAAAVRVAGSGKPRVEAAVAQARRATERSMFGGRRKRGASATPSPVASLCHGDWMQMCDREGRCRAMRLAWISPARSQFIFTDRLARATVVYSEKDLEQALQEARATPLAVDRAVDRALDQVLRSP